MVPAPLARAAAASCPAIGGDDVRPIIAVAPRALSRAVSASEPEFGIPVRGYAAALADQPWKVAIVCGATTALGAPEQSADGYTRKSRELRLSKRISRGNPLAQQLFRSLISRLLSMITISRPSPVPADPVGNDDAVGATAEAMASASAPVMAIFSSFI